MKTPGVAIKISRVDRSRRIANQKLRRRRRREVRTRKQLNFPVAWRGGLKHMRIKLERREHVFEWPLKDSLPQADKVRVVCFVPERSRMLDAQLQRYDDVTNELTNLTKREWHTEKWNQVYDVSVLRIENAFDQNGVAMAKEKLSFLFQENCGLDEDVHGVFQTEFEEWFQRRILRSELAKKNLTGSPNPVTDFGAAETNANPGPPTSPSTVKSPSTAGPTT